MAASEVDISNLALSLIGDSAVLTSRAPPDNSSQAEHCSRFYPIALGMLLSAPTVTWVFASSRIAGVRLATVPPGAGFDYAYARPLNCARVTAVLDSNAVASNFMAEGPAVLTNVEPAVLVYQLDHVAAALIPEYVVPALATLLASMIAGPIVKGSEGRRLALELRRIYKQQELPDAANADMAQHQAVQGHSPDWIAGRL